MAAQVDRRAADNTTSAAKDVSCVRTSLAIDDDVHNPSHNDVVRGSMSPKVVGSGAKQVLDAGVSEPEQTPETQRQASTVSEDEKQHHPDQRTPPASASHSQGLDLSSLWFTASLLLIGISLIMVHGWFYYSRKGKIVPNSQRLQAFYLGVGNACALVVTACFAVAVRFAWTQAVWTTLRRSGLTLGAFDVAFNVPKPVKESLRAFWELIDLTGLDFGIRALAWSLQLIQVFTPSSLTVYGTFDNHYTPALVPGLAISDPTQAYRFAYFQPTNITAPNANPGSFTYQGARTILTRIATATASFGQILTLPSPSAQSTYSLDFLAPYILCDDANTTTSNSIEAFVRNRSVGSHNNSFQDLVSFYAFVPSFDIPMADSNTITVLGTTVTALDQPRPENTPRNATNELWIKFFRYETNDDGSYVLAGNGSRIPVPKYMVCTLWNASVSVQFNFTNGYQAVTLASMNASQRVSYPSGDPFKTSDLVQHAYTSWFQVITDQIVGSMGLTLENSPAGASNYSFFETQLEHTSLLGSNDLDFVFDQNRVTQGLPLANVTMPRLLSDQRLQDKALARNRTLDVLIEELGFNLTISLMTDPLLAPSILAQISRTTPVNRYAFHTWQLWTTYLVLTIGVTAASCRGIDLAARRNKAVHDMDPSSVISSAVGDNGMKCLYPNSYLGLPAHRSSVAMRSKIRFTEDQSGWSLRPLSRPQRDRDSDHLE